LRGRRAVPYNPESRRRNLARMRDEIIAELQAEGWTIRPPKSNGEPLPLHIEGKLVPRHTPEEGRSQGICRICEIAMVNERWHLTA
jgi:hypothetical protein